MQMTPIQLETIQELSLVLLLGQQLEFQLKLGWDLLGLQLAIARVHIVVIAPEDKEKPQESVQGQKVQATGSETEENPRNPSGSESTRCQPEDYEGDPDDYEIPTNTLKAYGAVDNKLNS
uniref:Uncharacterized protein n=1 Tax=Phlebotomus papatasi TaxID=29031 RepID=A0A1B0CYE0_PHLPP